MNPSGCRSRSLNAVKVRYLDRRRTAASCSVSFQIVISSTSFPLESGCKITHFFAFSNFYGHFFQTFCKKIHKSLYLRYVLRQVFRKKEKEAGKGTQYIITRVQVRARLGRAEKSRKGENSCRMKRKTPLEGWNSLSDDTKKIRKYSPRNGKNVRSDGKFMPENEDFSAGKFQKKRENDENGEKNFFPCTEKNMKIIPTARKKCLKLGNGKRKSGFFF